MKKLLVSTVCVLLLCLCSTSARAVTLTCEWTGAGDGANYSDSYNWDYGVVPCNVGSVEFEVNVPDGFSVNVDTPSCEISELLLGKMTELKVPGNIYTVLDIGYINNSYVHVDEGGTVTIPAPWYSSTGLTANNNHHTVATYTWNLFTACDSGTLLDLSSLQSIDAGFSQNSNDRNRHEITASLEGIIDLSSVADLTAPAHVYDWIRFNVSDANSEIRLDSLETIRSINDDRGRTLFNVTNGGLLSLPGLKTANNVVFDVAGGSTIEVKDSEPVAYSSKGITTNNNHHTVATYTWNLFTACDSGTLLDLSSLQSIDAGFSQNSNDRNRHEITACNGGIIDLSSVADVTAPAHVYDWIRFNVSDAGSEIKLNLLETLNSASRGRTLFNVTNEGLLSLPGLKTANNVVFDVAGGSTIEVKDSEPVAYSSKGITTNNNHHTVATYTWNLFTACDSGTLLDLSSLQSIDAGFSQNSNDRNRHEITACNGGIIDLSGVQTITGPSYVYDRLNFIVSGGLLKLGNLSPVGYTYVTVTGTSSDPETAAFDEDDEVLHGQVFVLGNLNSQGDMDIELTGNESGPETATLEVEGDVILNKDNPATLILSEATLKVGGNLQFSLTDEEKFKTADILNPDKINSIVHFDGSGEQLLEVGGLDVDLMWELLNNNNFGFGKLIVGQEGQETVVRLQDNIDNGNGCEALYLFGLDDSEPNGLHIHEGSTLILDGINVYALRDGVRVHINSLFPPGVNEISYDGGGKISKGAACKGDFDDDGDVDGSDLAVFASEFGRSDCSPNNPCVGDFCRDGDVDGSDLAIFAADFGRTDCPTWP